MNPKSIYIYGKNTIEEALKAENKQLEKIFVRHNLADAKFSSILNLASRRKVPVSHVPGKKLYDLVGSVNDQGIAALLGETRYQSLGEWLKTVGPDKYPAILLLNEIEDPHNLGAILRTAAAAGLQGVLVPKHRQAPITPAVYKTSAGTAGRIPIIRAGNFNQAVLKLKDNGFWIAGLDMSGEQNLQDLNVDRPLAFVIGNEGRGIRKKTLEHCDYTFSIPMENEVESLNASVSAGLICYEWKRKRVL